MNDLETWVRSELAVVAAAVTPSSDPFATLARRRRFGRWRRGGFLAGIVALAAAGAGTFVALAPAGSPSPRPTYDFTGQLHWVAGLVDAPPRGAVAQDASFRDDLSARVEELSREKPGNWAFRDLDGHPLGEVDAWVLFADDIAGQRVAAIALQRINIADPRRRYPLTRLLWLTAGPGASPEELADQLLATRVSGEQVNDAAPLATAEFDTGAGFIRVGLAPAQCLVATAPGTDPTAFRPEPTGSYLVRTPAQYGPEQWRVTCDGVIHEQRPARRNPVTDDDVDHLLEGATFSLDREIALLALTWVYANFDFDVLDPVDLLWSGEATFPAPVTVPGRDPAHSVASVADVVVLTAPAAHGGWIVTALVDVDLTVNSDVPADPFFSVATDPSGPDALLAARLGHWGSPGMAFVLAPSAARKVRVLGPDGSVLVESVVTNRAAVVQLPAGFPADMRVEAVDAAGRVIATVPMAKTGYLTRTSDGYVDNWD